MPEPTWHVGRPTSWRERLRCTTLQLMLQPTHSLCRCMRLHVQLRPTEMRGPGHYGTLPGCNYAAAGSSPSHYVMADDLRVMLPEPASAATAHYSTGASCPLLLRSCTPPFGVLNFSGLPRPTPMRISSPPAHYFSGDKVSPTIFKDRPTDQGGVLIFVSYICRIGPRPALGFLSQQQPT